MLLGYLNWLLDCVTLLGALLAVHATVPWAGVLLAYGLGQLVAGIPLLPGGGGTVEAALALGLVAVGGRTGAIVAGVILPSDPRLGARADRLGDLDARPSPRPANCSTRRRRMICPAEEPGGPR
jgi:hypothetical protein